MGRSDTTSAVVDKILGLLAGGTLIATALLAPNAIQALDKPLKRYFDKLDERARGREYKRLLVYMKGQNLVKFSTGGYEHGIKLTQKGRSRVDRVNFASLEISKPKIWDKTWRIIFFDIPESNKNNRDQFSKKIKALGFVRLQRSVWVHAFPCQHEIGLVANHYNVEPYVTYIETGHIENETKLKTKFSFSL